MVEGTLFTYFATKDDLLNELYVELKSDAHRRINAGVSASGSALDAEVMNRQIGRRAHASGSTVRWTHYAARSCALIGTEDN